MFREEIARKNTLISQLLEKQDKLEGKLTRMETVLSYDKDISHLPTDLEEKKEESKQEQEQTLAFEKVMEIID